MVLINMPNAEDQVPPSLGGEFERRWGDARGGLGSFQQEQFKPRIARIAHTGLEKVWNRQV